MRLVLGAIGWRIAERIRSVAGHLAALVLLAAVAGLFTQPVWRQLTTAVVGSGAADNIGALWNVWWARTALDGAASLFWTPDLFAPVGTSLALHSFHPLISLIVTLLYRTDDAVALYNAALIASVFLNLACAYVLGWVLTRDHLAAFFAGVAFGASPFLLVRLLGHLNVLSAWGLPLFLAAVVRYEERPGRIRAILVSGAFVALGYSDYYYAIFAAVLFIVYIGFAWRPVRFAGTPLTNRRWVVLWGVSILLVVAIGLIAWIVATGGTDTTVVGIRLRMTDTFNLRVVCGVLSIAAVAAWFGPCARVDAIRRPLAEVARYVPVMILAATALLLPLLVGVVQLWRSGDYASQVYFWRSAPTGIDVSALVLGNPIGRWSGWWTMAEYSRFRLQPVESAVWLGFAPMALMLFAVRRLSGDWRVRVSVTIGGVFFIWSLGPYLEIFGRNSGFMLPQTFLRFVPVVANARIPGRAFTLVVLSVAVIGALALSSLSGSRRWLVSLLSIALLLADFWPLPFPTTSIERPPIYKRLATLPSGALLELPFGIRDGFGERGRLNHLTLFYQTLHGQPLVGGFLARVSDRIKSAYDSDPVLSRMLDLSEGSPARPLPSPCTATLACAVRYVMFDERATSQALEAFANETFELRELESSDGRQLFAVEGLKGCRCSSGVDR